MMKELPPIGGVRLDGPFIFGPMAGITDAPMRRIARRLGASLCYTEMISSKGLWYDDRKTWKLLYMYGDGHFTVGPDGDVRHVDGVFTAGPGGGVRHVDGGVSSADMDEDVDKGLGCKDGVSEAPVAVQIFGHEPEVMAAACEKIRDLSNAVVDINMGCPVPKVFKNGDGSAMMKDPDLAGRVVEACVRAAGKPVTVKIRLGVDDGHINCVEMARTVEQAGAAAVALHARTREQFYSGDADWEKIAEVKDAVGIPVIGNGDVRSADDALRMMRETGCDYVMTARAALGDPWIFQRMSALWRGEPEPAKPDMEAKKALMLEQLGDMCSLKGEYAAVREMRKIVGWYIKGQPGSAAVRGVVNQIGSREEMEELIERL